MSFSNSVFCRLDARSARVRLASGLGLAAAALLLGACAQPASSSMGAPGQGMEPGSAPSGRVMRQRQATPPGNVNQSDTNFERADQPNKSGPPSIVEPAQ